MEALLFDEESRDHWSVTIGDGARWVAWHTWADGHSDQVDGYVEHRGQRLLQLDVSCLGRDDVVWSDGDRRRARAMWDAGGLLVVHEVADDPGSVLQLVVPDDRLTTETIVDAVGRWAAMGAPRQPNR